MSFLSFSGRATRSEYWRYAWIPFLVIPSFVGVIIFGPAAIFTFDLWLPTAIAGMFSVAILVQLTVSPFWLGITVRRLHDTGRSAWWLLPYAVITMGWVLIVTGFLFADRSSLLLILIEWYSVIWVLVSWTFVIRLLILCSGLGTIGSNRYGTQPGVMEESDWDWDEESVLRSVGVLGFLSLAVASAMVLLAGCILFSAFFVLPLITGTFIEGRRPEPEPTATPTWRTVAEAPEAPSVPPRWAPGGGHIVFGDRGRVYSVDVDGTSLRLIHGEGPLDRNYSPDVSPDGTRIAYLSSRGGHPEIVTSALDGTDERVVTDLDNRRISSPSWSPDGSRIAFVGGDRIYTISADGSDLQVVANPAEQLGLTEYVFLDHLQTSLVWSPDGRRLAFVARAQDRGPDEPLEIYTIGVDGSDPRKVGQGHSVPAWSPDSGRLAFAEIADWEGGNLVQLYTVGSDGSDLREINKVQVSSLRLPGVTSWSPDGSAIMVGPIIATVDGYEVRLLPERRLELYSRGLTSWSRGGSWIAIQDSHRVYTAARDGAGFRVLVRLDIELPAARSTP